MREGQSNSRIAFQATAEGGDGSAVVLDLDWPSRSAPPSKK
jgi:hypothetical protein